MILASVAPTGTILVSAIPASMVITVLVQVVKRLGVPSQYAPLVAILLGVAYTLVAYAVRLFPGLVGAYQAVGAGLTLGLASCGLYSGSKALVGRSPLGSVRRVGVVRGTARVVDRPAALPAGKDSGDGFGQ